MYHVLDNVWMMVKFVKRIFIPAYIVNGEILEYQDFNKVEIMSGTFDELMPEICERDRDGWSWEILESRLNQD